MKTYLGAMGVSVFVIAVSGTSALSHEHATGIVKERMEIMKSIAKGMKAISQRLKSKSDLAAIKVDAEAIAVQAPHIIDLFPKGSTQPPTEARASIWQNWPDFESKVHALEIESDKLVKQNTDDFAALSAQVQAVSQTCSACHTKYRVKK